jgi:poly(3-hydroxybutyrate) depolymerase
MRTIPLLILLALPALAEDELGVTLSALRAAERGKRDAAVEAVLALGPEMHEVVSRLKAGIQVPTIGEGWHLLEAVDGKGVKRPYQVYFPVSLKGMTGPVPLMVSMHGGVSRPEFIRELMRVGAGAAWDASAEEEGFVCAFPMGRQDCTWWSDAGVDHVRAVIREVKRFAPIDDDRIVGSGFSDGGSGAFYLALAAPDPFACFLPMNGHPAVASAGSGHQLYLRNLKMVPLLATMTQDDQLYPAATILPHIEMAMRSGARILTLSYPTGGHRPVYFEEQRKTFERFFTETKRDPHPKEIDWWCADPARGRFRWVEVLELGPTPGDAEALPDLNIMTTPSRVRIGIYVDQAFAGEGVRVLRLVDDSLAKELEMRPGDVVIAVDEHEIKAMRDLQVALGSKTYGDEVLLVVHRGEEILRFKGRFPEFKPEPIYQRDKPAARVSVRVEEGVVRVLTRNVRKLKLLLPPGFNEERPFKLLVNGKEGDFEFRNVPLKALLERYAREADAGRLFTREVLIDLGGG